MAGRSKATLSLELPGNAADTSANLIAILNDRLRQISQAIGNLQGANGPVTLLNALDMSGYRIEDVADAVDGGDAVSRSYGDRRYLGAVRTAATASASSATASTTAAATSSPGRQLELSVPGTLGIGSNQAPLVELPTAVAPTSMLAVVKGAPSGAALTAQINAGGTSWQQITIADGRSSASISSGLGVLAANSLITLDLISVGTAFPGNDLSVLIRFS